MDENIFFALICMACTSCCSTDGPCAKQKQTKYYINVDYKLNGEGFRTPLDMIVKSAKTDEVILNAGGKDYKIVPGPSIVVFSVGETLTLRSCPTGNGPNSGWMMSLRNTKGNLVWWWSGIGWNSLSAQCIPKEIKISEEDLGCCAIDDDCGNITTTGVTFNAGAGNVTIISGQIDKVPSVIGSYKAFVSVARNFEDNGRCSDQVNKLAQFCVFREP